MTRRTCMLALLLFVLLSQSEAAGKHLLLLGETGAGKSTLGNLLLAEEFFEVGHDLESCTSSITTVPGRLFGTGEPIEVSDTGGLGDSEGRDEDFVEQVAAHLRKHDGFHGVVYVHNACLTRINKASQEALLKMVHTLSDQRRMSYLWRRIGIAFMRCPERRAIYETYLPELLEKRFNVSTTVPMFWITGPECGASCKAVTYLNSMFFEGEWQQKMSSWLEVLPPEPFLLPDETTREQLKRDFEANRRREEEERRAIKEKLRILAEQVEKSRRDFEKSQRDMEEMKRRHEQRIQEEKRMREEERAREEERRRNEQRMREEEHRRNEERVRRLEREVREAREVERQPRYYSGGGGGGSSGGGCFGASSRVTMEGGGEVFLRNLRVGDRIATAGGFTEVVVWMHKSPEVQDHEAINISGSSGALTLTADHFVYVQRKNQPPLPVPAWQVLVGDRLLVGPASTPMPVTSVKRTTMHGYYAPLTSSGALLVNGIWASCYVEVGLPHFAMHKLTAPWRRGLLQFMRPQGDAAWSALGSLTRGAMSFSSVSLGGVKRLLLIGETGAGKSTFGNMLLAAPIFTVGHNLTSCTLKVESFAGRMFGWGAAVQVSDTGGLGDSNDRDEEILTHIVEHVRSQHGVHGIIYVQSTCSPRLNTASREALVRLVQSLSNKTTSRHFWRRVSVAFTQCFSHTGAYEDAFLRDLGRRFALPERPAAFWPRKPGVSSLPYLSTLLLGGDWRANFSDWVKLLPSEPLPIAHPTTWEQQELEKEQQAKVAEEERLDDHRRIEQLLAVDLANRLGAQRAQQESLRYQ